MDASFTDWMAGVQADVEDALSRFLPAADAQPTKLHEAMRYTALGGGKRVRPLLVYASGALFGADAASLARAACALEMIHVYSLVHDDMPCMDDDALRRGKPTVHVAYDEATALLVGDTLQAMRRFRRRAWSACCACWPKQLAPPACAAARPSTSTASACP